MKKIIIVENHVSLNKGERMNNKNPILNEVKNLVADRDMTLTALASKMEKRLGRHYSLASLSQKLRNGTIPYKEIRLIANILNYKIIFFDLNKNKTKSN